jgi:hypothetical protein
MTSRSIVQTDDPLATANQSFQGPRWTADIIRRIWPPPDEFNATVPAAPCEVSPGPILQIRRRVTCSLHRAN